MQEVGVRRLLSGTGDATLVFFFFEDTMISPRTFTAEEGRINAERRAAQWKWMWRDPRIKALNKANNTRVTINMYHPAHGTPTEPNNIPSAS